MHRIAKLLVLIGALCCLAAGVGIGVTLAAPTGASAAPAQTLGTATPPPQPTDAPTDAPTQVPPPATPPPESPAAVSPSVIPSAQPSVQPTNTPRPQHNPTHTPEPTATAVPTTTPEPWTTEVEIVKQANQTVVLPGDTFTYTLVARNTGGKTAVDVIVRDTVPAQLDVTDVQSTKGDIAVSGQTVTAYPRTLEPGESATYRITVRVRATAQPGQIPNTGIIMTTTPGDTPGNNTSTVTVEIRRVAAPRLPTTAEATDVPVIALLASVPPLAWIGMFGGLLLMIGGVLSWGLQGWLRRMPGNSSTKMVQLAPDGTVAPVYRVPAAASAGPPRLGSVLPAAAPPAPLPPLVQLDRDDALRDAVRSDPEA